MKNSICFVTVGQAGGNIADLLSEEGYKVLSINTSEEDLATLKNVELKYHVQNGKGCSKDRTTAKYLLSNDIDRIIEKIRVFTEDFEFVYVVFSAGGGTGSGMGPTICDILLQDVFIDEDEDGKYNTKYLGAITILASDIDSPQARENSIACFHELMNIEGLSGVWCLKNCNNRSIVSINRTFVNLLTSILDIPSKYKSVDGNVDKSEIMKSLSTYGINIAAMLGGNKVNTTQILEKLRDNIFAPLNQDSESKGMSYIVSSTQSPLNYDSIKTEFGLYRDEFHTFNQEKNIVMLTGLEFPTEHLDDMGIKLSEEAKKLAVQNTSTRRRRINTNVSILDTEMRKIKNETRREEAKLQRQLREEEELRQQKQLEEEKLEKEQDEVIVAKPRISRRDSLLQQFKQPNRRRI